MSDDPLGSTPDPQADGPVDRGTVHELDDALTATDHLWGDRLALILEAPIDLAQRTKEDVREALLTRSVMAAGGDLLSLGWNTMRLIFGDPTPDRNDSPRTGDPS